MATPTSGRYFTIECKVGKDSQRNSQSAFERMVIAMGGLYILAWSVEDAVEGVLNGATEVIRDTTTP